jgi:hypothetical protein
LKEYSNQNELEIKRIVELFDGKNTIIIPKTIISNSPIETNFTVDDNYKQRLYERPKHYIIHSHKNSQDLRKINYEATIHDRIFLKYENNLTLEEVEKVISDLENDVNKGEMIPYDRIKDIIIRSLPDKKSQADKLAKVSLILFLINMLLVIEYLYIVLDIKTGCV